MQTGISNCRWAITRCDRWQMKIRALSTVYRPRRKQEKSEQQLTRHFIDFRRLKIKAGDGGKGAMSFLSVPFNEWAGPDGGDGGNGAHVIFKASHNCTSLSHLKSLVKAPSGVKGATKCCHGKNADHLHLIVPVGTMIKDEEGSLLSDLERDGAFYVAARGGAGGKGNHYFLSNENRAPMVYEEGGIGEEKVVHVELRIMAHAGLIGLPNVGKSTLLQAISRARPKVAAYPFTTLKPSIGMVEYPDLTQIAVADIPGLIEGAHQNKGLGFAFLRHIQRCRCLLYVLDLASDDPDPLQQLRTLQYELEQYSQGLSRRPHAIIGNKLDLPAAETNLQELRNHIDLPVFGVSAKKVLNIKPLLLHLKELYEQANKNQAVPDT